MVRFEEHLQEIRKTQEELDRARPGTPHWKDLQRRLRKLRWERAEALKNMKKAERMRRNEKTSVETKNQKSLRGSGNVSSLF